MSVNGSVIMPCGTDYFGVISTTDKYNPHCVNSEPGFYGGNDNPRFWMEHSFLLSDFIGQTIQVRFDFGSDEQTTFPGWRIGRVRVRGAMPSASEAHALGQCMDIMPVEVTALADTSVTPRDTGWMRFSVTNVGSSSDTYQLTPSQSRTGLDRWDIAMSPPTVTLSPNAGATVLVYVTVPSAAAASDKNVISLEAHSVTNPELQDVASATVRTKVSQFIFREMNGPGHWLEVPLTLDHVALLHEGLVYESHPGYDHAPGPYWDPLEGGFVNIDASCGVMAQHTLGSFQHNYPVIDSPLYPINSEVKLPPDLAYAMVQWISTQMGRDFLQFSPDCEELACKLRHLHPDRQKGLIVNDPGCNNDGPTTTYTCVGLLERAAEEVGFRNGEGFIANSQESFQVPTGNPFSPIFTVPLLTPSHLAYAANLNLPGGLAIPVASGANNDRLIAGVVSDTAGFVLTDPAGRRLGHTAGLGTLSEIPGAFYSGRGPIEHFIIHVPMTGIYQLELMGNGELVEAAFGGRGSAGGEMVSEILAVGETRVLTCEALVVSSPPHRAPTLWALYSGRPNPFSRTTTIRFDLPAPGPTRLRVFDVGGRLVRTLVDVTDHTAGSHDVLWHGVDEAGSLMDGGIYFCRLEASGITHTMKLVLLQ